MAACSLLPLSSFAPYRGISFDKLGQFAEAIADFTRVLELDPSNVNAYFNRWVVACSTLQSLVAVLCMLCVLTPLADVQRQCV